MTSSQISSIQKRVLGDYIEGIDSNNLDVSIWNGVIEQYNIGIKKDFIEKLNLPISLKYSNIGKQRLDFSLTSISSKPIKIQIDGQFIVLEVKNKEDWEMLKKDNQYLVKFMIIQKFTELSKQIYEQNKDQEDGDKEEVFGGMTQKIIDNLEISIRNVHIRLEKNFLENQQYFFIII